MPNSVTRTRTRTRAFCALCRSRCGCIAVVEGGDRLVAIEPDPSHPTGAALCAKGRAAPELVAHPERLLHPLRRTRPKGDPDPGWERISWDEALEATAEALRGAAAEAGPESVAFGVTSPSGTAISDAGPWVERLIHAFGSPNNCYATEICNWHKDAARAFTDGAGIGTPDLANAGCMLFWGQNPSATWLAKATRAAAARARGAKLVVVDPRRVGLAVKADEWLRVRPGTDGALALGIAGVMVERGWYDRDFLRDWSNGPLLVRDDTGRLLRMADVAGADAGGGHYAAWDEAAGRLLPYDPAIRRYGAGEARPRLRGAAEVTLRDGTRLGCRTAFDLYAALCAEYPPDRVAAATGVPAAQLTAAARLLWEHRPVAHYGWSGIGQHTNATQTDRAIALLYALTGSFDAPGGNVAFPKVSVNDVAGAELMPEAQRAKALGRAERPLGPPRSGLVTTDDLYRAIMG